MTTTDETIKRKTKSFTQKTADSIIQYRNSTSMDLRNKLFEENIYDSLYQLCHIVVSKYLKYNVEYITQDALSYIVSQLDSLDDIKDDITEPELFNFLYVVIRNYIFNVIKIDIKHKTDISFDKPINDEEEDPQFLDLSADNIYALDNWKEDIAKNEELLSLWHDLSLSLLSNKHINKKDKEIIKQIDKLLNGKIKPLFGENNKLLIYDSLRVNIPNSTLRQHITMMVESFTGEQFPTPKNNTITVRCCVKCNCIIKYDARRQKNSSYRTPPALCRDCLLAEKYIEANGKIKRIARTCPKCSKIIYRYGKNVSANYQAKCKDQLCLACAQSNDGIKFEYRKKNIEKICVKCGGINSSKESICTDCQSEKKWIESNGQMKRASRICITCKKTVYHYGEKCEYMAQRYKNSDCLTCRENKKNA